MALFRSRSVLSIDHEKNYWNVINITENDFLWHSFIYYDSITVFHLNKLGSNLEYLILKNEENLRRASLKQNALFLLTKEFVSFLLLIESSSIQIISNRFLSSYFCNVVLVVLILKKLMKETRHKIMLRLILKNVYWLIRDYTTKRFWRMITI